MHVRILIFTILTLISSFSIAQATLPDKIDIGIMSFKPQSCNIPQWSVLENYLNTQIPKTEFKIILMSRTQLEEAIGKKLIDFVVTNPFQYTIFRHRYGLSAPLATVIRGGSNTIPLKRVGGTLFTLSDCTDINNLKDIRDKQIAVPFQNNSFIVQMLQYELFVNDLSLLRKRQLVITGLPHDNTVLAVIKNQADLGYARAGTLEKMASQGKLDLSQFKVIHPQILPDFPVQVSTGLYPEWPFASLSHIEPADQKKIIAALLKMEQTDSVKMPFIIQGFLPPANYDSVENLMRTLRIDPFNKTPDINMSDLWQIYKTKIIFIGLFCFIMILVGAYLLQNRQSLRLTKERLDMAIEGTNAGLWDWYVQTGKVVLNERWAKIIGYTIDELAPVSIKTWAELCHPDDLKRSNNLIQKHWANETGFYQCEVRMKHKNGSWVWVRDQGKVMQWTKDGKPMRMTGTHIDITKRKRYEILIQAEHDMGSDWRSAGSFNEQLNLCLQTALQVSSMDCGGLYLVDENDYSLRLTVHHGLSKYFIAHATYFGADSRQAHLIKKKKPVYARHLDLLEDKKSATAHERLKAVAIIPMIFQGRVIACLNVASHILESIPEHARNALESIANYTGSFVAQEIQDEQIRQDQRNMDNFFNTIEDMLFVLDMNGCIIKHNQVVAKQLGYSSNELIGKHIRCLHPEDRHHEAQAVMSRIFAGESDSCSIALKTKHGKLIPVETKVKLGRWQDKEVIFGTSRDITERIEIEQRRQQIEKTEGLNRMAGAVAHNFNNILTIILGNLELAMEALPPETYISDNIKQAFQAAQRAADISRQMLVLLGNIQPKLESIDLSKTCLQHLHQLRDNLIKDVSLKVDILTPGPVIKAEDDLICKILTALVTNAWEAIDDFPGTVQVTVGEVTQTDIPKHNLFPIEWSRSDAQYGCLTVTDTGRGMNKIQINKIFDPFYTDKFTGRGLGLPVALGIIKTYGGCITVKSEPGKGSSFRIFLPLAS
ncbi:PAS domain S-box protein [Desulfobacula toluolica]|uniref:histidine kinase n=1 Tax=Desulfobacula toluolica (strain DSM 7467 / Tol2) TaxID=651182 RepID=K0NK96_DESTT|nr:PAS domain S-box protein [Desulfobacula toluolica]CCK81976.1 two component system sensor histidine kinase, GAF region [Desulfobacula toluolica Tol2]